MGSPESPFKANILQGKVAFVTGGSSGIGFELARQLGGWAFPAPALLPTLMKLASLAVCPSSGAGLHGAKVAISGRRQQVLDAASKALEREGIVVLQMQGDVRSSETCEKWVAEISSNFGGLDILVNCAAGKTLPHDNECLNLPEHKTSVNTNIDDDDDDRPKPRT